MVVPKSRLQEVTVSCFAGSLPALSAPRPDFIQMTASQAVNITNLLASLVRCQKKLRQAVKYEIHFSQFTGIPQTLSANADSKFPSKPFTIVATHVMHSGDWWELMRTLKWNNNRAHIWLPWHPPKLTDGLLFVTHLQDSAPHFTDTSYWLSLISSQICKLGHSDKQQNVLYLILNREEKKKQKQQNKTSPWIVNFLHNAH